MNKKVFFVVLFVVAATLSVVGFYGFGLTGSNERCKEATESAKSRDAAELDSEAVAACADYMRDKLMEVGRAVDEVESLDPEIGAEIDSIIADSIEFIDSVEQAAIDGTLDEASLEDELKMLFMRFRGIVGSLEGDDETISALREALSPVLESVRGDFDFDKRGKSFGHDGGHKFFSEPSTERAGMFLDRFETILNDTRAAVGDVEGLDSATKTELEGILDDGLQLIEDARQSLMDGSVSDYMAFVARSSSLKGRFTDAISVLEDDQREAIEEALEGVVYDNTRGAGIKRFPFGDKERSSFGEDSPRLGLRRLGSPSVKSIERIEAELGTAAIRVELERFIDLNVL